MVTVSCQWVAGADHSIGLPEYATAGAAGADLRAHLPGGSVTLAPGDRRVFPTGVRMAIPEGFEVQIRPRSGLAIKHGITLPNSPGTIDWDYRGEVGVILQNAGDAPFEVTHGMRIAQMVVAPVVRAVFNVVEDLDKTGRGTGGYGSTGAD